MSQMHVHIMRNSVVVLSYDHVTAEVTLFETVPNETVLTDYGDGNPAYSCTVGDFRAWLRRREVERRDEIARHHQVPHPCVRCGIHQCQCLGGTDQGPDHCEGCGCAA